VYDLLDSRDDAESGVKENAAERPLLSSDFGEIGSLTPHEKEFFLCTQP